MGGNINCDMPQYNRKLLNMFVKTHTDKTGIQGSFWCEAKQNPRESAVWRDFTWGIDLMDHYKDVSRTGDLWKFIFSSFFSRQFIL